MRVAVLPPDTETLDLLEPWSLMYILKAKLGAPPPTAIESLADIPLTAAFNPVAELSAANPELVHQQHLKNLAAERAKRKRKAQSRQLGSAPIEYINLEQIEEDIRQIDIDAQERKERKKPSSVSPKRQDLVLEEDDYVTVSLKQSTKQQIHAAIASSTNPFMLAIAKAIHPSALPRDDLDMVDLSYERDLKVPTEFLAGNYLTFLPMTEELDLVVVDCAQTPKLMAQWILFASSGVYPSFLYVEYVFLLKMPVSGDIRVALIMEAFDVGEAGVGEAEAEVEGFTAAAGAGGEGQGAHGRVAAVAAAVYADLLG